jgi:hypothetical protein
MGQWDAAPACADRRRGRPPRRCPARLRFDNTPHSPRPLSRSHPRLLLPLPPTAVKMRIRATKNVSKITNVMKLVASSKLRSVEEALNRGRGFGVRLFVFFSFWVWTSVAPRSWTAGSAQSRPAPPASGVQGSLQQDREEGRPAAASRREQKQGAEEETSRPRHRGRPRSRRRLRAHAAPAPSGAGTAGTARPRCSPLNPGRVDPLRAALFVWRDSLRQTLSPSLTPPPSPFPCFCRSPS